MHSDREKNISRRISEENNYNVFFVDLDFSNKR